MALTLQSSAFHDHGRLPVRYTCEGGGNSPPLRWSGLPDATSSLALILDDPDARGRTFSYWLAFNLPPDLTGLVEDADVTALEPPAREGTNDQHGIGFLAPCPWTGRHCFVFRLHALDRVLDELIHPHRGQLDAAMGGHVLETAELRCYFESSG